MKFNTRLTSGRDKAELEKLRQAYRDSQGLLEILKRALTDELNDAIIKDESRSNYDCPNLLPLLADQAGYRRGLRYSLSLLST